MKKLCSVWLAFLLFSSIVSATQNSFKFLLETEMPQRVFKAMKPQARFFSQKIGIRNYGTTNDISEKGKTMQVFSRPTYDRIAKHILSNDESVRIDILRAFTGISTLSSAMQLDEHHNPFDPIHNLRKLINSSSSQTLFEKIRDSSTIELSIDGKKNKQASEILKGFSSLYDDLSHAFPSNSYRSTVDFLCETDFGYITIEFQVAKQDYWDKRALAYIASVYGNQLRSRKNYDQIQDVIGVNLLGDGSTPYWKDGDFMRDYTFMNQRGSKHKIPSLRLIQYSFCLLYTSRCV